MMGTDRSKLSCRTLLFLFALLGTPIAARCDTLEDSAQELARKIATVLPPQDVTSLIPRNDVSVEIRNLSSMLPEEIARVNHSMTSELRSWGIDVPAKNEVTAKVVVTLSASLKSYVLTAEIFQGNTTQVFLTSSPRPLVSRVVSGAMLMTLHSDKFWEGPDRIIDVTFVFLQDFEQRMVLLVPDGLIITKAEVGAAFKKVEFPIFDRVNREPDGSLGQIGNHVDSWLDGQGCEVALDTETLIQCHLQPSAYDLLPEEVIGADKPKFGDQKRGIPNNCGISDPELATDTGDYTQPDSVQIIKNNAVISNQLNFPGPVLRFSQGPDTQFVTAIVHNLKDGNYEVYRLSISCGQ